MTLWERYYNALKKQEWQKALTSLEALKEMKPRDPQVHLKMGDLLQRTGDVNGSVEAYHKAALYLIKSGFHQKALAIYKVVLRLKPKDETAIERSGRIIAEMESSKTRAAPFAPLHPPQVEPTAGPAVEAIKETPVAEEAPSAQAPPFEEMLVRSGYETEPSEETPTAKTEEPPPPYEEEVPEIGEPLKVVKVKEGEASELLSAPEERLPVPGDEASSIFASLDEKHIRELLKKAEPRIYENGKFIVEEGDSGDSMFILKRGKAKVVAHIMGKAVELARLKEGDVFGEIAFLTGRPRTASVIAEGEAKIIEITRPILEDMIEKNPNLLESLQDFYHSRVQGTLKKIKGH